MRAKRSTFAGAALLLLAVLAVAGCGGGGNSNASSGAPKTASGATATIGVSNESLGNILVNSQGRTVYVFTRDSGSMSECSGACAVSWPPVRATGKPTIGSNQQRRDSVALGFEPAIANPFDASRNPQSRELPHAKGDLTGRLRRYRKNRWLRGLDLNA